MEEKEKSLTKTLPYILKVLLIVLLAFSVFMFARPYLDSQKDKVEFVRLQKEIEQGEVENSGSKENTRFQKLVEENDHFFGWVKIEGTSLNYPVMHTAEDPEYYLRKDFNRNYSISGVPFIGGNYDEDGKNTLIYGHNMANGTMFSVLADYKDKNFWKKHPIISFDTLSDQGKYEIIAIYNIDIKDAQENFRYNEYTDLNKEDRFIEYIKKTKERALYETEVPVEFGDQLLTLSTCSYHTVDGRCVVVAKRIN